MHVNFDERALGGRYRILESIGRGGMGEVFLAEDLILGRRVAIKRIITDSAPIDGPDNAIRRLYREARSAARIHHPNIVTVHDVVVEDDETYIIMEYVAAPSLAAVMREERSISRERAAGIGAQVAAALAGAHDLGIVHRDVKPANILVDAAGQVKLADFGVARSADDVEITQKGNIVGSVAYLAPEVARGDDAGPSADIFSLGATLFASIEGYPPFVRPGESSTSIRVLTRLITETAPTAGHAGPITGLLAQMLHPDPTVRPSAQEVNKALLVVSASSSVEQAGRDAPEPESGYRTQVRRPAVDVDQPAAPDTNAPSEPATPDTMDPSASVRATDAPPAIGEEDPADDTLIRPGAGRHRSNVASAATSPAVLMVVDPLAVTPPNRHASAKDTVLRPRVPVETSREGVQPSTHKSRRRKLLVAIPVVTAVLVGITAVVALSGSGKTQRVADVAGPAPSAHGLPTPQPSRTHSLPKPKFSYKSYKTAELVWGCEGAGIVALDAKVGGGTLTLAASLEKPLKSLDSITFVLAAEKGRSFDAQVLADDTSAILYSSTQDYYVAIIPARIKGAQVVVEFPLAKLRPEIPLTANAFLSLDAGESYCVPGDGFLVE